MNSNRRKKTTKTRPNKTRAGKMRYKKTRLKTTRPTKTKHKKTRLKKTKSKSTPKKKGNTITYSKLHDTFKKHHTQLLKSNDLLFTETKEKQDFKNKDFLRKYFFYKFFETTDNKKWHEDIIILLPGSTNLTSDWDVTILCNKQGNDFFRESNFAKKLNTYPNKKHDFNECFDSNMYIGEVVLLPKSTLTSKKITHINSIFNTYPIKNNKNMLAIYKGDIQLEIAALYNKTNDNNNLIKSIYPEIPQTLNVLRGSGKKETYSLSYSEFTEDVLFEKKINQQLKYNKKIFDLINDKNSSTMSKSDLKKSLASNFIDKLQLDNYYLRSRKEKDEAYHTISSLIDVVIEGQLGIKPIITKQNYYISAMENILDYLFHVSLSIQKNDITINPLLKYSKYIKRIYAALLKVYSIDCKKHKTEFCDYFKLISLLVENRGKQTSLNDLTEDKYTDIIKISNRLKDLFPKLEILSDVRGGSSIDKSILTDHVKAQNKGVVMSDIISNMIQLYNKLLSINKIISRPEYNGNLNLDYTKELDLTKIQTYDPRNIQTIYYDK
jgi:hypothetical protein